ncbi:MAG: hypothetical protein IPP83_08620 [Flavobacteriales bacterium]|nr:hypothetical protein [Flavobacteriales bacterium]
MVTVTAAPNAGTLAGTPQGICVGGDHVHGERQQRIGPWGTDNASVVRLWAVWSRA